MKTATHTPLVVDLDGTLTPTDTLIESIIKLVKQSPLSALCIVLWLFKGRGKFKSLIATHTSITSELLPYHESLLLYLRNEKKKGRRIILATAAHKSIAESVSAHLDLFDDVLATDKQNIKGKEKLRIIQEKVGKEFVYAGDSRADIPIWKAAQAAILVGVSSNITKIIRQNIPIEKEFPKISFSFSVWVRALRVHQWLKNLLLFVPLLTAFSVLSIETLIRMVTVFFAFSLLASATYIVNDLLDLENDRKHPRKKLRPFASAKIPILSGLAVAVSAFILAFLLSLGISKNFFLILIIYLLLTSSYSWALKEYVLIDVLMLSILYTLRILAGSVAFGITISSWLFAFSIFIFLSLALVKRCSELITLDQIGEKNTQGRDYRITDLVVLYPLGVGTALSAIVIFGLFISDPKTQARYATPQLLWLVAIVLIYWLARLWIKTSRGEMHDDPVIFAIKDRGSCMTVLTMIAITLIAHFLSLNTILHY